jgi:two-component system nitrate/nitrite response regulator NarL
VIDTPVKHDAPLTPREREVVKYVAHGYTNRAIGVLLGCTEGTVKQTLWHVTKKVGARNRVQLTLWYYGLLHEGETWLAS